MVDSVVCSSENRESVGAASTNQLLKLLRVKGQKIGSGTIRTDSRGHCGGIQGHSRPQLIKLFLS